KVTITTLDPREESTKRGSPVEDLVPMPLYEADPTCMIQVRSLLELDKYDKIIDLLKRQPDIFAWSH
ncbi:hypothetical protein PJI17_32670, partial [Mycobacterium kansasii]